MRIAVLSGSYRPGYSYQENIWAEQLAARGHTVRVFTPARPAVEGAPAEVEPVAALGWAPRNLYRTRALAPAVRLFGPVLILWFGPPQGFGVDVARDPALADVPLVAFMGQNRAMQPFEQATTPRDRLRALAYRRVRGPAITWAARRAALIVANTPETPAIVRAMLPAALRGARIEASPLGFDPATFAYDPARRRAPDGAVVAVVSSRFAPDKAATLRRVVDALDAAMGEAPRLRALVVGFDGGETSRSVERRIAKSRHAARFERRGFVDRAGLAAAYHHADLAVFARPSISAQEALGTGLYAVLADGAMAGLIEGPDDGARVPPDDDGALAAAIVEGARRLMNEPPSARADRARRARRLGYDRIIDAVLAAVRC